MNEVDFKKNDPCYSSSVDSQPHHILTSLPIIIDENADGSGQVCHSVVLLPSLEDSSALDHCVQAYTTSLN